MTNSVIAIDIGGTKIAAALVDASDPTRVLHKMRVPTPPSNVVAEVSAVIRTLLDLATETVLGVGIGAPGVIDPFQGTVVSSGPTMAGWAGTAIAETLSREFALPIAVHNDVRIMGLGEATFGAGQHFASTLFVSLGTGVGGAIVRDGKLQRSPHFTAGELRGLIGRQVDGAAASIEDFASGTGLAATYNRLHGTNIDLHEIMRRYDSGDSGAREVIAGNMTGLGEALAGFASAIDVDAIVVGGGVGTIGEPIMEPLTSAFRASALPPLNTIPIIRAELGADAPLVGAAWWVLTTIKENKK